MAFDLNKLVRENIRLLVPYSSARGEFGGKARIFLDANENSFGSPLARNYNRYPDPRQATVKKSVAELKGTDPAGLFIGNGSDEAIDLLFRIFCRPQIDNVLICPPTYGMYEVAAAINDVPVRRAALTSKFELDVDAVKSAVDANTKLIFICSPNNPSGNLLDRERIRQILNFFDGLVVLDEAYIDFAGVRSMISEIGDHPNLVVLQTFSKAWGLAGLRVGLAFAETGIIDLFNRTKPPYNVSQVAQELVLEALQNQPRVCQMIAEIVRQRNVLANGLKSLSFVSTVYPSDANFLLVRLIDANSVYRFLLSDEIVVRNRSNVALCEGCLRITIGTQEENQSLLSALEKYEKGFVR